MRYDLAFPVKGTDWHQGDRRLGRPDPRPARSEGASTWAARTATRPRSSAGLWVGRWWYWADYPALDFAIDDIRLEPTIDREHTDYRLPGQPLARVLRQTEGRQAGHRS